MNKAALDAITDKVLAHGTTAKRRSNGRRTSGKSSKQANKGRNSK